MVIQGPDGVKKWASILGVIKREIGDLGRFLQSV